MVDECSKSRDKPQLIFFGGFKMLRDMLVEPRATSRHQHKSPVKSVQDSGKEPSL